MLSSEPLKDLSSAPVSRRTVAAGLWAAPVVALVAAAPAVAASGPHTVTVSVPSNGCASNTSITFVVTNTGSTNLPAGTGFSVSAPAGMTVGTITGLSGSALPGIPAGGSINVTVTLSGTPSSNGNVSVSATVSGTGITGTLTAASGVRKGHGNVGWACG